MAAPLTVSTALREFWTERHLSTLTTLRPSGRPHVVPVGVTVDEEFRIARVICSGGSVKARNVRAAGPGGALAVVSQVDWGRWSTLEGRAVVRDDQESVRDAERRYALRYQREPRPNPERVVLEITIDRLLGLH
ncbi:PPOX class probable F420-dependent enzyme [Amycolatopsis arida]|uniref:PPOX class probable F420-dependent enzyme n=1 Tax=Amycolatopsis arida TaxID=587909 RepID=A0A1I5ZQY0_9PSEU|nr:PPOX class F420-dependent oxidoreductase [Amycolatopsis arida]TDX89291.1 PPOX class probable F420-dependent enzyme [Amycolatopsis arida]SFQ58773.1 PPOX class probable F420-dependent enzyme [Amycolatopsis arida]